MSRHLDISGERYGRLVALARVVDAKRGSRWIFQCDCGSQKVIDLQGVRSHRVRSCGCLHMARCATGLNRRRHGDACRDKVTRLHNIWRGMLKRCAAKSGSAHMKYASRGITVCAEWTDYSTFKAWANAAGYTDDLSIERIDNDGNYEPGNCRWITMAEQASNRRTTRWIEAFGKRLTLSQWSRETGVGVSTIAWRLKTGRAPEQALAA